MQLLDANCDLLRTQRRTVRAVRKIGEQQLQAVFARSELDHDFGLTTTEVPVLVIRRDRPGQVGQAGIDQQMVMPGFSLVYAGGCDTHAGQAEHHLKR